MQHGTRKKREVKSGELFRKSFSNVQIRGIDSEKRQIDFVISTESEDRYGDIIRVSGWDLKNYKKNPVVLFGHNGGTPPIGKALNVKKDSTAKVLRATAEFMAEDLSAFAYSIFRMYEEGYLKAVSVGFMPLDWEWIKDEDGEMTYGIDFKKQELLEFSAVPIPANPEALIDARSKGIDTRPVKSFMEYLLDHWNETGDQTTKLYGLDRKKLEAIRRKAAGTGFVFKVPSKLQEELRRKNFVGSKKCEIAPTPKEKKDKRAMFEIKRGFNEVEEQDVEALTEAAKAADLNLIELFAGDVEMACKTFLALPRANGIGGEEILIEPEEINGKTSYHLAKSPKKALLTKAFLEGINDILSIDGQILTIGADTGASYKLIGSTRDGEIIAELIEVKAEEETVDVEDDLEDDVEDTVVDEEVVDEEVVDEVEVEEEDLDEDEDDDNDKDDDVEDEDDDDEDEDEDEDEDVEEGKSLYDDIEEFERGLGTFEENLQTIEEEGTRSIGVREMRKLKFLAGYMRELADGIDPQGNYEPPAKANGKKQANGKRRSAEDDSIAVEDIDEHVAEALSTILPDVIQRQFNKLRGRLD